MADTALYGECPKPIRAAGFLDVQAVEERRHDDAELLGGCARLRDAARSVISATIRAVKPTD